MRIEGKEMIKHVFIDLFLSIMIFLIKPVSVIIGLVFQLGWIALFLGGYNALGFMHLLFLAVFLITTVILDLK